MRGKRVFLAVMATALVLSLVAGFGLASWALRSEGAPSAFRAAAVSGIVGVAKLAAAAARTTDFALASRAKSCGPAGSAVLAVDGKRAGCGFTKEALAKHVAAMRGVVSSGKACAVKTANTVAVLAGGSCSSKEAAVPALVTKGGALTGKFDDSMSGVCQGACAVKADYRPDQVSAQPGAAVGKLTQCPVSGVVFRVKKSNARMAYAGQLVYTCCESCATRLKAGPARFLHPVS